MADPTYQMLWRCTQCQTPDLLALTQRFCPNCGTAQDPANRYFPEEGKEVAVENHRYVGADWPCGYCEAPNSAAAAYCTHCGGPREGNKEVARVTDASTPPPQPPTAPTGPARRARWPWVVLGVVIVALIAWASLFFSKHDETLTVVAQDWRRTVEVEQFVSVPESAWCDALPTGAYQISRTREQRDTRRVEDGQVCHDVRQDRGDGTFVKHRECETRWREEPVYDDRCRFRINRWQTLRTDALQGNALLTPSWPSPQLAMGLLPNEPARLGAQRLGSRSERYDVRVRAANGKEWSCTLAEDRWRALKPQSSVTGIVRGTGGLVCDSLGQAGTH